MAGHSHWAGIKHKKGKADKQRSKIFSKLSKEITVAAKLGDKDPAMNSRLRSAIQAARSANMPKDNIERAIDKSSINSELDFENLRYEGFGPEKVAVIVETLTNNKNRTAGTIRAILQKFGGNLGTTGSTVHYFDNLGIIQFDVNGIPEEKALDFATTTGAIDCFSYNNFHEITCKKADFYKIKNAAEKLLKKIVYSGIEWRPKILNSLNKEDSLKIKNLLEILDEDDDIQSVFHNCKFFK